MMHGPIYIRLCNTYCLFTVTMVTRTRLSVTSYENCRVFFTTVITTWHNYRMTWHKHVHKACPILCQAGTGGKWRYSCTHIRTPEGLVKATPRLLYFPDKDTVTDVQEGGWASGIDWTGLENLALTGLRNSNTPAISQSPYLLRYPGSCYINIRALILEGKYDMIYDILLTVIGLTPGGSTTVHIYTQTVHRATQWNWIHRTEHI